jgi:hypothetical protein
MVLLEMVEIADRANGTGSLVRAAGPEEKG